MSNSFEFKKLKNDVKIESIDITSILERINDITTVDLEKFRMKINPDMVDIFDKLSDRNKEIVVLLEACSDEELLALMDKSNKDGKILGLHDVNNHLTVLEAFLDDGRIDKLKKILKAR